MQNTRNRKPASEQWTDASPSDLRPLTATVKYGSPQPLQPMPEDVHRSKISGHSVVSIVTLQDAPQPCPDLLQRLVHPAAQRLLNLLQLGHHPLVRRLSPDREPALRTGSTLIVTVSASQSAFSKLNTRPTDAAVYASRAALRGPAQNSRSGWIRYLLSCKTLSFSTSCRFYPGAPQSSTPTPPLALADERSNMNSAGCGMGPAGRRSLFESAFFR